MVGWRSALRVARLCLSFDALISRYSLCFFGESSFSSGSFIFCFRSLGPRICLPVYLHMSVMYVSTAPAEYLSLMD